MYCTGTFKFGRLVEVCLSIVATRSSQRHKDPSHEVRSTLLTGESYQRLLIGLDFEQEDQPKVL